MARAVELYAAGGTQAGLAGLRRERDGREPRKVTDEAPSYWHGWSPDGKTMVYCAERGGNYDVYAIPAGGGKETRLTTDPGLDDGPEYSPDGALHLLQLDALGPHEDLADEARRQRAGAGELPTTGTTGSPTFRPTGNEWSTCPIRRRSRRPDTRATSAS